MTVFCCQLPAKLASLQLSFTLPVQTSVRSPLPAAGRRRARCTSFQKMN
ncbi:hypothetical protein [Methanimicrococcus hongohii]|nr:hypothetical protein [Methanimicrococcus sp. Hf6]